MSKSLDSHALDAEWDQLIFSTCQILSCEVLGELVISLNLSNELSIAHGISQLVDLSANMTTIIIHLEDLH